MGVKLATSVQKIFKAVLVLVLLMALLACFVAIRKANTKQVIQASSTYQLNSPFEIFATSSCEGEEVSLPNEEPYLVVLFAEWCPHCKPALKYINKIAEYTELPLYGAMVHNQEANYIESNFNIFKKFRNIGHLCLNGQLLSRPVPALYLVNPKGKLIAHVNTQNTLEDIGQSFLGLNNKSFKS